MQTTNLFCFSYAGASVHALRPLKEQLASGVNFKPVERPGRGSRITENLLLTIEEVVEDALEVIEGQWDEPYAFYGHSMGTTVAFALVMRLLDAGLPLPQHLFFSGKMDVWQKPDLKNRHLLGPEEFWQELRDFGGMPEELLSDKSAMEFFEPIIRADFHAVETYVHEDPRKVDIPITGFIGINDPYYVHEKSWADRTTQKCKIHKFAGGHFFINKNFSRVGMIISEALLEPKRV